MRSPASTCDTILDLIDDCLAEYDADASDTRPDHGRSPRDQRVLSPSAYLINA